MKAKSGVEWITVWFGAVVATGMVVGAIVGLSRSFAEKDKKAKLESPELADVNLKVPDFDELAADAKDVDALLTEGQAEVGLPPGDQVDRELFARWSYTAASGPEFWAQLDSAYKTCAGPLQSPVDLPSEAEPSKDLQPIRFLYKDLPGQMLMEGPVLRFKPIQGHSAVIFDETFYLTHIDFHVPAEHQIDAQPYDLEIQLFHRNVAGRVAVVAVLAQETRQAHQGLKKLLAKLPGKKRRPVDVEHLEPDWFLPQQRAFHSYTGSLTTPPCGTKVRWAVMTKPIAVSDAQIDTITKAIGFTARPLQGLGQRTVSRSWR